MPVSIQINPQQLEEIHGLLENIQNGAERAIRTALNKTLTGAVALTAKRIGETVTLKASMIKDNITQDKAKNYRLGAMMQIKSPPMPLAAFTTNPTAANYQLRDIGNGVSVKVWKKGSPVRFRHAFFARTPNGYIGLFERRDKRRLPIDEMRGPFLASIYEKTPGLGYDVETASAERLLRELDHQVTYLLGLNASD
ncbi:MAG: phage tail protein [Methylococcaceae bacterium]|jgi:hypothetical protein